MLAAVLVCATAVQAQDTRPIRARDAAAANARDVHELVAQLRPDWLLAGGDPADPASRDRVRVYVGRTLPGGLEALHGLPITNLHSVQLAGPARARQLDERGGFDVAAVVLVRYENPDVTQRAPRRIQVTAGIGGRGLLEERTIATLRDAGFQSAHIDYPWVPPRTNTTFTLHGGAAVGLRGNMGVALNGYHSSKTTARGIRLPPSGGAYAVTNRYTTTDLAAMAYAGTRHVRLAAGPAARLLDWEQGVGGSGRVQLQTGRETVLGAASDVSLTLPPSGRFYLQVTAGGRWFPRHTIPARISAGAPETDLGGVTTYTSIDMGFGLF